jgi:hypothetical protein
MPTAPGQSTRLDRLALAVDILIVVLIVGALLVAATGGFRT